LLDLEIDASIGTMNGLSMVDGYAIVVLIVVAVVIYGNNRLLVVLSYFLTVKAPCSEKNSSF
jgi:hypothetical protein